MAGWDQQLHDYMIAPKAEGGNYALSCALGGWNYAKGVNCPPETTWWGAAAQDVAAGSDEAWNRVYAANQEQPIAQDDGTDKNVMIVEFQTLVESLKHELTQGPMPNGTWIGGNKHRITQKTMEKGGESGDIEVVCMLLMRPGEKGHVVCGSSPNCDGKSCIVTAEFDKSLGCTAAMAKQVAIEFCAWLKTEGVDEQVQE